MFEQFKERLHNVQQDLSASLKTLSTKAKEVKIPRRDELTTRRKDIPSSVPVMCNHDAGAELLDRFQQVWCELHQEIEASAEKAMVVDTDVQQIFLNYERRAEPLVQLQKQLQNLPRVVENIQHLTASIGKLEADFEEVESMLAGFVDLIEHCDLLRNKQTQTSELARYTQQKRKEEELMKVRLQQEYEQTVLLKEESQRAGKMERQQAFQEVFTADMDHYRTHGEMQCLLSLDAPRTPTDISSVENFKISVDDRDQKALNDFLDTLPGNSGDEDDGRQDEEDGEDEEEVDIMEVIDEESERDEGVDETDIGDSAVTENANKSDEADQEDATSQDEGRKDEPVGDNREDDTKDAEETRQGGVDEEEEEDDDEFDTPEEGSDEAE